MSGIRAVLILGLCTLMLSLGTSIKAEARELANDEYQEGDWIYSIGRNQTSDESVAGIRAYVGSSKDISIPKSLGGLRVDSIEGDGTFLNAQVERFDSIYVPSSVTWIMSLDSWNAKKIVIDGNSSGTVLYVGMFSNDSALERVELNGRVILSQEVMVNCPNLESVKASREVVFNEGPATGVNDSTFTGCPKLTVYCYENSSVYSHVVENKQKYELIQGGDTFVDVDVNDWYFQYVNAVYEMKIMTGLDAAHFGPGENLARAQFSVILHRMNGEPEITYTSKFPDVLAGQWYTDAILWANSINVVNGYSSTGLFGPGDNINREQMAVMMYRYAQYKGYDISQQVDFSKFSDAPSVSDFAKDAMKWAVGAGIITGKSNGTQLEPQGNASRAECATIIMRFIEKYDE